MRPLTQLCFLAVVVLGATVARPSAEVSQRDARGQTVLDGADPLEKPRSMDLIEAYKGGVVPVALLFDNPENSGVERQLRDTLEDRQREDKKEEVVNIGEENSPEKPGEQDSKGSNKNSKLLDLEARVGDDNAKFGLGIQSRNKIPSIDEKEELDKPFVYNIQPLSYYSSDNILQYINKIKELRENQMKLETVKQQESKPEQVQQKHEDAVVTESESEENRPIRRRIQHYETVIKPMAMDPQVYGGLPQGYPMYPASTMGLYPHPYQQNIPPNPYQPVQSPSVLYLPNPFRAPQTSSKTSNTRIFDDYFPILVNNPFNEIWAGITNIIEYGPSADVCRKNKKGRVSDDEVTTEIDLNSQRGLIGLNKPESWPKFARLKVRRGGVAIAGPGGIATAGSGGTAIVGPGGTAYTTRDGTAVVGPGGRVVHVPHFPIYAKEVEGSEPRDFVPPPGSRTVAEGPIVYFDNPLEEDDLPDPALLV